MNVGAKSDGTVGKALNLLDLVANASAPMRFSEIQAQSPHPKATLHRLLQTLVSQRMLSYDPDAYTFYHTAEYIYSQPILNNIFFGKTKTDSLKVQDKINEQKQKGVKVQTDKDW